MNKKVGLDTIEQIKTLAHQLKKHMKDKGVDISHAILLESIAKSLSYKDWNTLVGLKQKNNALNTKNFKEKTYIHIDNGGYNVARNEDMSTLMINSSFYGYSDNNHYFDISPDFIFELAKKLTIFETYLKEDSEQVKDYTFTLQEGSTTCSLKDFGLIFANDYTSVTLPLSDKKLTNPFLAFLKTNSMAPIYPLTDALLCSMAMRLNHAFGLIEDPIVKKEEMDYVEVFYHLFAQEKSNEEICLKHNLSIREIAKIREEVMGEGFYKPVIFGKKRLGG